MAVRNKLFLKIEQLFSAHPNKNQTKTICQQKMSVFLVLWGRWSFNKKKHIEVLEEINLFQRQIEKRGMGGKGRGCKVNRSCLTMMLVVEVEET